MFFLLLFTMFSMFRPASVVRAFCDLYKIGLMSGNGITYDPVEAQTFLLELQQLSGQPKIYLKNSLIRLLGVDRKTLPENFVESNYNMFG